MQLTVNIPDDLIEKVKDRLSPVDMLETIARDAILDFLHLLASGGGQTKAGKMSKGAQD